MLQRLVFTILTAVSLSGLYVLYAIATRPIIVVPEQPPQTFDEVEIPEAELPAENVRVAQSYIPLETWAAGSQHTLRFEQAFVYTDKWELDEETKKNIHFKPFAMIWVTPNKQTGEEEAVTVVSQSAQLEFETAFNERNRSAGRVVRAYLKGEVEIKGPNNLAVRGKEFVFDESTLSVTTYHPVKFKFQSHAGKASRMQMNLLPGNGPPSKDRPHVSGIESVQLFAQPTNGEYVRLTVSVPQGDKAVPVHVRCSGDLTYSFATSTAVLTKNVWAVTGSEKNRDSLECETMTMKFAPRVVAQKDAPADKPKNSDFQKIESDLEFRSFDAIGQTDGKGKEPQLVVVKSASQGVQAQMTSLSYSMDSGKLLMTAGGPLEIVKVVLSPTETRKNWANLSAPVIDAILNKDSLESMACQGEGEFMFWDEDAKPKFRARWHRRFNMKPDPVTKLNLVELEEKADFVQPDQKRGLAGELLQIWLAGAPLKWGNSTAGTPNGQGKTSDLEPKRIVAKGDIVLRSPEMVIARASVLDVRFEEQIPNQPTVDVRKSRSELRPTELKVADRGRNNRTRVTSPVKKPPQKPIVKRTQVGFANVPVEPDGSLGPSIDIPTDGSQPRSNPQAIRKTPAEPFVVEADRILATMLKLPGSQEPKPAEVQAEGRVVITQKQKNSNKPLRLEGNRVQIQSQTDTDYGIKVFGVPALIEEQRMRLEGKEIHFEQNSNHAKIVGAGVLTMAIPTDASKLPFGAAPQGRELLVKWLESMDFDGENAEFIGKVQAKMGLAVMHCEQMLVQMSQRISFRSEGNQANPELKTIVCRENVRFENSAYLKTRLTEVYRGNVGEFVVDYDKGDINALGPGQINVWQLKKVESEGTGAHEINQANRPIATEVAEWNYTQLQFEGTLKGNFNGQKNKQSTRQSATITDRVEVVHGPVESPTQSIDPDRLPSRAGTIRCKELEVVNYSSGDATDTSGLQLKGKYNAEIEGQYDRQMFAASADEITFDGAKSLYSLRSYGKQSARITQVGIGSQNGRWIEFNPDPKRRVLRVDGALAGEFSQ